MRRCGQDLLVSARKASRKIPAAIAVDLDLILARSHRPLGLARLRRSTALPDVTDRIEPHIDPLTDPGATGIVAHSSILLEI